ncbi:hypothetical protein [Sphingomonas trueperi]|uniref:hypothetical protein n=1 Tax=Sphingomonas trueperi TaxID=53317 RepID=UPI000EB39843
MLKLFGYLRERKHDIFLVESDSPGLVGESPAAAEGAYDALTKKRSEQADQPIASRDFAVFMLTLNIPIEPTHTRLVISDRYTKLLCRKRKDQLSVCAKALLHW